MARDDFGFDFDEHTDVPTYQEIASKPRKDTKNSFVERNAKKSTNSQKKYKDKSQPNHHKTLKKIFTTLILALILIAVLAGGGYGAYHYRHEIGNNMGKITGNFAVKAETESEPRFAFVIQEVPINLKAEEERLITTLNANCEDAKGDLASDIRTQKDNECTKKLNPIEAALDKANDDYLEYKDKYEDCKEDLDICEGAEA